MHTKQVIQNKLDKIDTGCVKKNECMKIEQDIETVHNSIVPAQSPSCPIYINIISISIFYVLNKHVDFWVELELKDWNEIIVLLFLGKQLRCDILIFVFK